MIFHSFCPMCEMSVAITPTCIHSETTFQEEHRTLHSYNLDCPVCHGHFLFTTVSQVTEFMSMEIRADGVKKYYSPAKDGKPVKWVEAEE